jgi:poly(A) polymerase
MGVFPQGKIVGGVVRDMISRAQNPNDADIIVDTDPLQLFERISKLMGDEISVVPLDRKRGVYRAALRKYPHIFADISSIQGNSLLDDLLARDFTVNAMAMDIGNALAGNLDEVIDPLGGRQDLKELILKVCSHNSFEDDPLRILRAFRFRFTLGMVISPETLDLARKSIPGLGRVSGERIRDELARILCSDSASKALDEMESIGVILEIMPELSGMKDCGQNEFHHLDVWGHTLESIRIFESIGNNLSFWMGGHGANARTYLDSQPTPGRSRVFLLKLALLFHDAGKPAKKTIDQAKGARFYGHEKESSRLFYGFAQRMRLSNIETSIVTSLIGLHMRVSTLTDPDCSDRAIYRLIRDGRGELPGMVMMFLSDLEATRGWGSTPRKRHIGHRGSLKMLDYAGALMERTAKRLVTGDDLIEILGMKPGPSIGAILKRLDELQAIGRIRDRIEAIGEAKRMIRSMGSTNKNIGPEL